MSIQFPLQIGPNKEFLLTARSFKHIVDGDFVVRPRKLGAEMKTNETVLAGGLHTLPGWRNFLKLYEGIVHLAQFDPLTHTDWYFARELQNGVITLKLPRRMFSGDGADMTMSPDIHYKSGYLWKTLFPGSYSSEDIVNALDEALHNVDKEESSFPADKDSSGLVFGYARVMKPFEAIRIRFQLHGNEIRSAFPSWDQPLTGNNGKAYSHETSIAFQIATSTIEVNPNDLPKSVLIHDGKIDFKHLIELTPPFLKSRIRPELGAIQNKWRLSGSLEIKKTSQDFGVHDVGNIVDYLNEVLISKEPARFQLEIYKHYLDLIESDLDAFNAANLIQNIDDCCWALLETDNRQQSTLVIQWITRFLAMAVIHTGGFDTLQYKRLFGSFIKIALHHHHPDSVANLFAAIASSPIRSALYSEFDLNPYVKKNDDAGLAIIGTSGLKLAIGAEHLFDYLALSFGENYLIAFSAEDRLALARSLWETPEKKTLLRDAFSFFIGEDFDFFVPEKFSPADLPDGKTFPDEKPLMSIVRDYNRMQVLYRQRIVLEDPKSYAAVLDFADHGTLEYFNTTRQKHKRTYVVRMHQMALEAFQEFAIRAGFKKLELRCKVLLANMGKERIPLPKAIPEYIKSWKDNEEYKPLLKENRSQDEIVKALIGANAD